MKRIKSPEEVKASFFCLDCNVDTSSFGKDQYYMVHDKLWLSVVSSRRSGMLCIECLEQRIGRQLVASDFKSCTLTKLKMTKNEKLMSRYCS